LDIDIWEYAKRNKYIIVTKDADFAERSILLKNSPKIVWIKKGNCSTKYIEKIIKANYDEIKILSEETKLNILNPF